MKGTILKMPIRNLLILLAFPAFLFATTPVLPSEPAPDAVQWELLAENGDVKAYVTLTTCGPNSQPMYVVKLTNESQTQKYLVEYQIGVSNDPTSGNLRDAVELLPEATLIGKCDGNGHRWLLLNVVDPNDRSTSYVNFKLTNLKPIDND